MTGEGLRAVSPTSRRRGRWSRSRIVVIALLLVCVGMVVSLATKGWSLDRVLNTCVGQDEEELADLRQVAAETLHGLDYEVGEISGCEYMDKAGEAEVHADVPGWAQRSAANRRLTEEGWIKKDFIHFRSPDGEHSAKVGMASTGGSSQYVTISFSHAD